MIKENPFLGVGFYNFSTYYDNHYSYDLLYPHAELPHNIFIQVGTDTGFIGGTIFFMIFVVGFGTVRKIYIFKNATPIERAAVAGLGYGLLGFLIAGQFVTITYYPFMWIHLAFIVALYNSLQSRAGKDLEGSQKG
jgi:O-antigen ligase